MSLTDSIGALCQPPPVRLNAIGVHADLVEQALVKTGAVVHRSVPVPLERLASALKAADLHLVAQRED